MSAEACAAPRSVPGWPHHLHVPSPGGSARLSSAGCEVVPSLPPPSHPQSQVPRLAQLHGSRWCWLGGDRLHTGSCAAGKGRIKPGNSEEWLPLLFSRYWEQSQTCPAHASATSTCPGVQGASGSACCRAACPARDPPGKGGWRHRCLLQPGV